MAASGPSEPGEHDEPRKTHEPQKPGGLRESGGQDWSGRVRDEFDPQRVVETERVYEGIKWDVMRDTFQLAGQGMVRDYVSHPGAVAAVVLNDAGEVLLQRQYRQATGFWLWEIPAGLLDVPGEDPVGAAQRELAEEADLWAEQWHTLVDMFTSPGGSDEAIRVFLARLPSAVPEGERYERSDEEAYLQHEWVPLPQAVGAVLAGDIHNPAAVAGLLAAQVAAMTGFQTVRSAHCPWQAHKHYRDS